MFLGLTRRGKISDGFKDSPLTYEMTMIVKPKRLRLSVVGLWILHGIDTGFLSVGRKHDLFEILVQSLIRAGASSVSAYIFAHLSKERSQ